MSGRMMGAFAARLAAYDRVGVQTGVEGASPHRLILMLMDGALGRIATARGHLDRGEIADKGRNISLAISIIEGLRASLDRNAGGALAENLDELYKYMLERLFDANVRNEPEPLFEVQRLLGEVRAGWAGIETLVETAPRSVAAG